MFITLLYFNFLLSYFQNLCLISKRKIFILPCASLRSAPPDDFPMALRWLSEGLILSRWLSDDLSKALRRVSEGFPKALWRVIFADDAKYRGHTLWEGMPLSHLLKYTYRLKTGTLGRTCICCVVQCIYRSC